MDKTIRICSVQSAYLDYLRQSDSLVSKDPSQNRKFIGILLVVNGHSYYAPLSSPKPKHQSIADSAPDIVKIVGGKLGVINLNNMIPVVPSAIIPVDISLEPDSQYKQLMKEQMVFIRRNEEAIMKKARRLYQIIRSGKHSKLNSRCCNFPLLEHISSQFGIVDPITIDEAAPTKSD